MYLAWERLDGRTGHEAGRELLFRMYREHYGPEVPQIGTAERGKPFFVTGKPCFSISHSKNHVFCCISEQEVGIDAEEMDRRVDPRLAERILSATERLRLETCADRQAALLRLWVLKEAAAKLSGEGLRGFPNQTDFDPEDPRIQVIDGCYVAVMEETRIPG